MKTLVGTLATLLALAFAGDSDAARRFGGGGNLGKQRAVPAQRQATPPAAAPATPAATPGAPAAKPGFMGRWGGMLAGLGIGALLASMFGASMGPIVGLLLAGLAVVAIGMLLFRLFAARASPAPAVGGARDAFAAPDVTPAQAGAESPRPAFSGIGSLVGTPQAASPAASMAPAAPKPSFETEPFLRVAKTSFIRLQAANDSGDLDDIRDYTTPEVYAEIAMQVKERGAARQRTEVVSLHAELVEAVVEGDYEIASVRFYGLLREDDAANPDPFDEIWHVRKDLRDRSGAWLIAGIQQAA